jgi:hypothetical protein
MNMKKFLILAAWAAVLPAQAQQSSILITGQELFNRMTENRMWVFGYVAGVADSQSGITICIPPGVVTVGQMTDMVKSALERVPSERHLAADIYVQAALSNRWPCSGKRGGSI